MSEHQLPANRALRQKRRRGSVLTTLRSMSYDHNRAIGGGAVSLYPGGGKTSLLLGLCYSKQLLETPLDSCSSCKENFYCLSAFPIRLSRGICLATTVIPSYFWTGRINAIRKILVRGSGWKGRLFECTKSTHWSSAQQVPTSACCIGLLVLLGIGFLSIQGHCFMYHR